MNASLELLPTECLQDSSEERSPQWLQFSVAKDVLVTVDKEWPTTLENVFPETPAPYNICEQRPNQVLAA